jgi:ribosome recycling factor
MVSLVQIANIYFSIKRVIVIAVLRIRIHFIRIRIQRFRLNTDPNLDPIRIRIQSGSRALMTKNVRKKLLLKKKKNFKSKTTVYLSLGLHKERPSYRRSLQISKEAIQHFKT